MRIRIALFAFFIFSLTTLQAQTDQPQFIEYSSYSEAMEQDRKIIISLPSNYYESNERYHVLYVFDAHWTQLRDMVIASCRYMEDAEEIYPLIIVGIEHEHRGIELTPPRENTPENEHTGGADTFLKYLSKEAIPYIDQNFRTLPYRIAVGHSFGGLFVSHTFINENDLFKGLIAVSPAFTFDKENIIPKLEAFINKKKDFKQHFYFSMGDGGRTDPLFKVGSDKVDSMLQTKQFEYFRWQYDFQPGKNHNTTPLESITNGLLFIYKDWELSDSVYYALTETNQLDPLSELAKHYDALSERVGYIVYPHVDYMNLLGYEYLERKQPELALQMFDLAVQAYPNDANIHDSKGEALEELGRYEEALKFYKLAMEKAKTIKNEENRTFYQSSFQEHIDRVKAKMDK